MDEWQTGDVYEYFMVFTSCTDGRCKGHDGYIYIEKRKTIPGNMNLDR